MDKKQLKTLIEQMVKDVVQNNREEEEEIFATFLILPLNNGKFAGTTRALDRADDDAGVQVGFPGGKVDPGEDPRVAALRETAEEGWSVQTNPNSLQEVYRDMVQGKLVVWYTPSSAAKTQKLDSYKEQHRIKAIEANPEQFRGFKNEDALAAYYD